MKVGRRTKGRKPKTLLSKEARAVPQGGRKVAPTRGVESRGGGKASPVDEQVKQLELRFETAENPKAKAKGTDGQAATHQRVAAKRAAPKSKRKTKQATPATMKEVTRHLKQAFEKVASNKGAAGPDGKSIKEVAKHLKELLPQVTEALLEGKYEPGNIRRVWIPKANGGQRGLGIPDVVDRTVSEAIRQVLEPLYEPTFQEQSHGFRPQRSCHTAIVQASEHIEAGCEWVVDLDLEKFFDQVCHQRLMAKLSQRVKDRELLKLIGRLLKAKVVMPDGVVITVEQGVPQGNPLSPLLSNIVLNELDEELVRRGHRFVRYADDCNIYVRSERAGQRVKASVTRFIQKRLRLKVNESKSAVARTEERHFVGFSLRRKPMDGEVEVMLSKRSKKRIDAKIRDLTPRNWGNSIHKCIERINAYVIGWIGFFGICTAGIQKVLRYLDAHIRRRVRAIQIKQWKRKRTIVRNLIRLGVNPATAQRSIYSGRKSVWRLSHESAVHRALRNARIAELGLVSLLDQWTKRAEQIAARARQPKQLLLALG